MPRSDSHPRLLTRRDAAIWIGAFLFVSILLVAIRFTSDDPDSALYAALSARLADGPPDRWIAPEWWGHWNSEGLFREHPIGVFLLPTLVGAAGVPGVQAAYVVGIAMGLACLLMTAWLTARLASPTDGRLSLVLLQLMPVAFIFRIRANHEYPMLLCLLVAIVGLDGVRRSWRWLPVPAIALTAALLVKGVFVVLPILAGVLWIWINPRRETGSAWRAIAAIVVAGVVMLAVAAAYDAMYVRATGETFWMPYWNRQLAPLTLSGPVGGDSRFLANVNFYLLRLLWHPAPWSLALVVAAWRWRGRWRSVLETLPVETRRGLYFCLAFAAASLLMLSPASRFAERYLFSANYAIGACGAIVALSVWPALRRALVRLDDRVPALPALCWLALMLLRLAVGPLLPRISG